MLDCNKEGHLRRQCPGRKKDGQGSKDSANVSSGLNDAEVLTVSYEDPKDQWILDSGCSFHMTPRKDWLLDFKSSEGKVLMGNNHSCNVYGTGSVKIKLPDGSCKIIREVRYIPDLKRNLFSLGVFDSQGYSYKAQKGVIKICKGILTVLKGYLENGLYVLEGETIHGEVDSAQQDINSVVTWHRRLGHMSQRGIQELTKQDLIKVKDLKDLEFCENCILGKAPRLKFPKAVHNTKSILDYVHSDLWGSPQVTVSLSKSQYFITFVDDFSRKTWIYFLKTKDEAFQKFVSWKTLIENQTEKKVKRLRTDNGLEL